MHPEFTRGSNLGYMLTSQEPETDVRAQSPSPSQRSIQDSLMPKNNNALILEQSKDVLF